VSIVRPHLKPVYWLRVSVSKRGLYLNHIDNYISKSMETGDTDFYHHFNHMTAEPLRVRDGVQLT